MCRRTATPQNPTRKMKFIYGTWEKSTERRYSEMKLKRSCIINLVQKISTYISKCNYHTEKATKEYWYILPFNK